MKAEHAIRRVAPDQQTYIVEVLERIRALMCRWHFNLLEMPPVAFYFCAEDIPPTVMLFSPGKHYVPWRAEPFAFDQTRRVHSLALGHRLVGFSIQLTEPLKPARIFLPEILADLPPVFRQQLKQLFVYEKGADRRYQGKFASLQYIRIRFMTACV